MLRGARLRLEARKKMAYSELSSLLPLPRKVGLLIALLSSKLWKHSAGDFKKKWF